MVLQVRLKRWDMVATWRWKVEHEDCSICHQPFDSCCTDCKAPGDDCPPVWGSCNHPFHMHCILKWLQEPGSKNQCPLDRKEWRFKGEEDNENDGEDVEFEISDDF